MTMTSAVYSAIFGTVASSHLSSSGGGVTGERLLAGYHLPPPTYTSGVGVVSDTPADFRPNGMVYFDPTKTLFGSGSTYIGGTGTSTVIEKGLTSSCTDIGSNDFCMEMWVAATNSGVVFSQWTENSAYRSFYLQIDNATTVSFNFRTYASGTIRTASATQAGLNLFDGNFHHIAVQRRANTIEVFINGIRGGTTYAMSTNYFRTVTLYGVPSFGAYSDTSYSLSSGFRGWISNFRLTFAYRYNTTTFTPPTAAFGTNSGSDASWASVALLVPFNSPNGFYSTGTKTADVTRSANPAGGSGYNGQINSVGAVGGGSHDYISTVTNSTGINEDFTVEFAVQYDSVTYGANQTTLGFNTAMSLQKNAANNVSVFVYDVADVSTQFSFGTFDQVAGIQHYTIMRKSGVVYVAKNGVWVSTTGTPWTAAIRLMNGTFTNVGVYGMALKGFKITKGQALYNPLSSYTPPDPSTFIN